MRLMARWVMLFCTGMSAVMGATITTEMVGVSPHPDLTTLRTWKYTDEASGDGRAVRTNPQLGENGTLYIVSDPKPFTHFDEESFVAWDFSVNGNTVHNVSIDLNWMRFPGSSSLVLDNEVAQRTTPLVAAQVLESDIFYRHYVTRFSLNYFDPFVYLGADEKQKYVDLFAGKNIYVQSLAKGNSDNFTSVSDKVITQDQWVPYSRHNIGANELHSTVLDDDIAPYLIFIRGFTNDRYLSPGSDTLLQARTISVEMDMALHKEALVNRIRFNEPVLFVDLVTLNMTCRGESAAQVLEWILNEVATLAQTPEIQGRYVLSAANLYQQTMACLQQSQSVGKAKPL